MVALFVAHTHISVVVTRSATPAAHCLTLKHFSLARRQLGQISSSPLFFFLRNTLQLHCSPPGSSSCDTGRPSARNIPTSYCCCPSWPRNGVFCLSRCFFSLSAIPLSLSLPPRLVSERNLSASLPDKSQINWPFSSKRIKACAPAARKFKRDKRRSSFKQLGL